MNLVRLAGSRQALPLGAIPVWRGFPGIRTAKPESCCEWQSLVVIDGSRWLPLLPTPGKYGPCPVEAIRPERCSKRQPAQGIFLAERRGFPSPHRSTCKLNSCPVRLTGSCWPRDHNSSFRSMKCSGWRDPSTWTVWSAATNHAVFRSHALPGVPGKPRQAPSGRPGFEVFSILPWLMFSRRGRPRAPDRSWLSEFRTAAGAITVEAQGETTPERPASCCRLFECCP